MPNEPQKRYVTVWAHACDKLTPESNKVKPANTYWHIYPSWQILKRFWPAGAYSISGKGVNKVFAQACLNVNNKIEEQQYNLSKERQQASKTRKRQRAPEQTEDPREIPLYELPVIEVHGGDLIPERLAGAKWWDRTQLSNIPNAPACGAWDEYFQISGNMKYMFDQWPELQECYRELERVQPPSFPECALRGPPENLRIPVHITPTQQSNNILPASENYWQIDLTDKVTDGEFELGATMHPIIAQAALSTGRKVESLGLLPTEIINHIKNHDKTQPRKTSEYAGQTLGAGPWDERLQTSENILDTLMKDPKFVECGISYIGRPLFLQDGVLRLPFP